MFGLGGISGGTLVNTVGGQLNFGYDLNGNAVTTYAQWQAAVAQLRTPAGRDYGNAYSLANPALYSQIEATLATTDTSAPSEEIDGNVNATLAALASLGIVPLVVTQVSCASFDFTTDDWTASAYWGERWELYKRACFARCMSAWVGRCLLARTYSRALTLDFDAPADQYAISRFTWTRGIRKIECACL